MFKRALIATVAFSLAGCMGTTTEESSSSTSSSLATISSSRSSLPQTASSVFSSIASSSVSSVISSSSMTSHSASSAAMAVAIPSKIQSEDFTGYQDSTPENKGGCGPNQPVDMQPVVEGNIGVCDINWTEAGEWLEYQVAVATQQRFEVVVSLASLGQGKSMSVYVGGNLVGEAFAPALGWTTYRNLNVGSLVLPTGEHTVRVVMNTGGLNFNFIQFKKEALSVSSSSAQSSLPSADNLRLGRNEWEGQCANCHGLDGQGGVVFDRPINLLQKTRSEWIDYIYNFMPLGNSAKAACDVECSTLVTDFMLAGYPGSELEDVSCNGGIEDHLNPPIRLLTTKQYELLIGDVFSALNLNLDNLFPQKLMKDSLVGGFTNNSGVVVDNNNLDDLLAVADKVGDTAASQFSRLMACGTSDNCIEQFVVQYGTRLFREAPTNTQITQLMNLFKEASNTAQGIKSVVMALLLSPQTVYQYEGAVDTRTLLPGRELAERLSFMIWNAAPDEALLNKADSGVLNTKAGVIQVANEMLQDARATQGLRQFYQDYLHIDQSFNLLAGSGGGNSDPKGECENTAQCKQLYDGATDCNNAAGGVCYCGNDVCSQLGSAGNSGVEFGINGRQAAEDITRFTSYLTRESEGTFQDLLLSRKAFVDNTTAKIYGVNEQQLASGNKYLGGSEVMLDENQRAGLLTRIGFVLHGGGQAVGLASPTDRGIVVRKTVLCQELPEAPGDIAFPDLPDPAEKTWVEVVKEVHLAGDTVCSRCHKPMDLVGFGFEHYTLNGQYIDTYPNGKPVDASGEFYPIDGFAAQNLDGQSFSDGIGLSELVAGSDTAAECFSLRWVNYSMARDTNNSEDACAVEKVAADFKANNYSLSELIVSIVSNPAFRFRNPE